MDAIEILENAQVNLENCEKLVSGLKALPMYVLAKEQLDNAIKQLEQEAEE